MPLYIISTPIGNLKDITLRAIETLKQSDIILAEDTRRTSILLSHYSIKNKQLISFNDKNKEKKTPSILSILKEKQVSLVSDSGTPGISDPGFYLIRESIKEKIPIIPLPGPTASISALIASGFPTDSFTFYGFIPKKEKAKKKLLEEIKSSGKTAILYESPYRIIKTLKLIADIMPERSICIAREMTKRFEEFIRGKPKDIYSDMKGKAVKGEITLVVSKA